MRRAFHRDAAEKPIIRALRAVGATVHQLNGKDVPDLLVGYRGATYLLEVKSRLSDTQKDGYTRRRTTRIKPGQQAMHEAWRGSPVAVVHDVDEALAAISPHGTRVSAHAALDATIKAWSEGMR
jgi:hypothetical protein